MKARADDRRIFDEWRSAECPGVSGKQGAGRSSDHRGRSRDHWEERPTRSRVQRRDQLLQADIASTYIDAVRERQDVRLPDPGPEAGGEAAWKLSERVQRRVMHTAECCTRHQRRSFQTVPSNKLRLLAGHYDALVANPPYMGANISTSYSKAFVNRNLQTRQRRSIRCASSYETCVYSLHRLAASSE